MSGQDKQEYFCASCKLPYDSSAQYEEHLWSMLHHRVLENNGPKKDHYCILCCDTYPTLTDYSVHLISTKHRDALTRWQKGQSKSGPKMKKPTRSKTRWDDSSGSTGQGWSTSYQRNFSHTSYYSYKNHHRKKPYHRKQAYHASRNVPSFSYEAVLFRSGKRGNKSHYYSRGNGTYSGHKSGWKQTGHNLDRSFRGQYDSQSLHMYGPANLHTMNEEEFNKPQHFSSSSQNQGTDKTYSDFDRKGSSWSHLPSERSTKSFSEDISLSQMEIHPDYQHFDEMGPDTNFINPDESVQRTANENLVEFHGSSCNYGWEEESRRNDHFDNDQRHPKEMDAKVSVRDDIRLVTSKKSSEGKSSLVVHVEVNKGCSDCSSHSRQENQKVEQPALSQRIPTRVVDRVESVRRECARENVVKSYREDFQHEGSKEQGYVDRFGIDSSEKRNEEDVQKLINNKTVNGSEISIPQNVVKSLDVGNGTDKSQTIGPGKQKLLDCQDMAVHPDSTSINLGSVSGGRLELPSETENVDTIHAPLQTESKRSFGNFNLKSNDIEMTVDDNYKTKNVGSPKQLFETAPDNHCAVMIVSHMPQKKDSEQGCGSGSDSVSLTSLMQSDESTKSVDKNSQGKQMHEAEASDSKLTSGVPSGNASPAASAILMIQSQPMAQNNLGASMTENAMSVSSTSRVSIDNSPLASSTTSPGPLKVASGTYLTENSQMGSVCSYSDTTPTPSHVPNDKFPQGTISTTSQPPCKIFRSGITHNAVSDTIPMSSVANDDIPPAPSADSSGDSNATSGALLTQDNQMSPPCKSTLTGTLPMSGAPSSTPSQVESTISTISPNMSEVGKKTLHGEALNTTSSPAVKPPSNAPNDKVQASSTVTSENLNEVTNTSQMKLPDLIQKLLKKHSSKPNLNSARSSHPCESSGVATGDLKRVLLGLFESPVPQHHRKLQEEQLKKLFAKAGSSSDRFKKFGVHLEMADKEEDEMIKVLEKLTEEDLELLAQNESHDILHELLSLYEVPGEIPSDQSVQNVASLSATSSSMMTTTMASSCVTSCSMTLSSMAPTSVNSSPMSSSSLASDIVSNSVQMGDLLENAISVSQKGNSPTEKTESELVVSSESEDDDPELFPKPAEVDQALYGQVFQLSCEENQLRQQLKTTRKELRIVENKIKEFTEKANLLNAKKAETKKKIKAVQKNRLKLTTDHVKQSTQGMASEEDATTESTSQKKESCNLPLQGKKSQGDSTATVSGHPTPGPVKQSSKGLSQIPLVKTKKSSSQKKQIVQKTKPQDVDDPAVTTNPIPGPMKQLTKGVSQKPSGKAKKSSCQKKKPSSKSLSGKKSAPKEPSKSETQETLPVPQLPVIKPGSQHSLTTPSVNQAPQLPVVNPRGQYPLSGPSINQVFPHHHIGVSSAASLPSLSASGHNMFNPSPLAGGVGPNYDIGQVNIPPEAMGISIQRISEEDVMKLVGVPPNLSSRHAVARESSWQQPLLRGNLPNMQGGIHQQGSTSVQQGPQVPDRFSQSFGYFNHSAPYSMPQVLPPDSGIRPPQFKRTEEQQAEQTQQQEQQNQASNQMLSSNTSSEMLNQPGVISGDQGTNRSSGNSVSSSTAESGPASFPPFPVGIIKVNSKQQSSSDMPVGNSQNGPKQTSLECLEKWQSGRNLEGVTIKEEPEDDYVIAGQNGSKEAKLPGQSESGENSVSNCSSAIKEEPVDQSENTNLQKVNSNSTDLPETNVTSGPLLRPRLKLRKVSVERETVRLRARKERRKNSDETTPLPSSKRLRSSVTSEKERDFSTSSKAKDEEKIEEKKNAEAKKEKMPKEDKETSNTLKDLQELKRKLKSDRKKKLLEVKRKKHLKTLESYKKLGLSSYFMEIGKQWRSAKKEDRKALHLEVQRLQEVRREKLKKKLVSCSGTKAREGADNSNESAVSSRERIIERDEESILPNRKLKRLAELRSIGVTEDLLDIIKKGNNVTKEESSWLQKGLEKYGKQLRKLKHDKRERRRKEEEKKRKPKSQSMKDEEVLAACEALTRSKSRALGGSLTNTSKEGAQDGSLGEHSLTLKGTQQVPSYEDLDKAIVGLQGSFDKLYAYCVDGSTRCLSFPDFKEEAIFSGHQKRITGLHLFTDINRNMKLLFTSSQDKKLVCFNLENNKLVRKHAFKQPINCMVGLGESVFLGLTSGCVEVFHVQKLLSYESYACHNTEILCLAISGNGDSIVSGAADGSLAIHSVTNGTLLGSLSGHRSSVLCVQVKGINILSGAADGRLLQHNIKNKRLLKEYSCLDAAITNILVLGNMFCTAALDDTVRVYNIKGKAIVANIPVAKAFSLCLYKEQVYVGTTDGTVVPLPRVSSD